VLTLIFTGLALNQYALLAKDVPRGKAPAPPKRLLTIWRREATPLILVALFTYFFADVAILMATPLLSADTAAIGLCLKLALLVGFAVQVAHQVVVPDLADARARKDHDSIRDVVLRALAFPLAITLAATVVVALWGEQPARDLRA
jgi:O-antigen/teichoic acid export membrane protein